MLDVTTLSSATTCPVLPVQGNAEYHRVTRAARWGTKLTKRRHAPNRICMCFAKPSQTNHDMCNIGIMGQPRFELGLTIERRMSRASGCHVCTTSTECNPRNDRQRTIGRLCHLDTEPALPPASPPRGRRPWGNGSFLFLCRPGARTPLHVAAALSTRLLRGGTCR